MNKVFEYYVILFNNNLTYLSETGYPTEDVSQAQQYTNLTVAKQDIENLDDEYKKCATIYKVKEIREYEVEKEGK